MWLPRLVFQSLLPAYGRKPHMDVRWRTCQREVVRGVMLVGRFASLLRFGFLLAVCAGRYGAMAAWQRGEIVVRFAARQLKTRERSGMASPQSLNASSMHAACSACELV